MSVRRISVLVIATLSIASGSAYAAELLEAAESISPGDRFDRAQNYRREGLSAEALAELDALRADHPDDVDYAFARALVLDDIDRSDEALAELDVAARLAPDYEDVWRQRLAIAARAGIPEEELEARRSESAAQFPEALWWEAPEQQSSWTMISGAGVDNLSGDLPGWDNQFLELAHERERRLAFRIDRHARYSGADTALGVSVDQPLDGSWRVGGAIAAAADPAFLPDFDIAASLNRAFDDGWGVSLGVRRREYPTASVDAMALGAEKYLGDFRLAWRVDLSSLDGASPQTGHGVTANWFYAEGASVGMSINTGSESESIGNGQVLETDVSGVSLSGRHPLTSRVTVQWWLGVHEQGDFYRRRFLGMAVSYRL